MYKYLFSFTYTWSVFSLILIKFQHLLHTLEIIHSCLIFCFAKFYDSFLTLSLCFWSLNEVSYFPFSWKKSKNYLLLNTRKSKSHYASFRTIKNDFFLTSCCKFFTFILPFRFLSFHFLPILDHLSFIKTFNSFINWIHGVHYFSVFLDIFSFNFDIVFSLMNQLKEWILKKSWK